MKLVLAIIRDEFAGDVVAALNERGARVRAVVRRGGTAPQLPNVEEWNNVYLVYSNSGITVGASETPA